MSEQPKTATKAPKAKATKLATSETASMGETAVQPAVGTNDKPLATRGRTYMGTVISNRMSKTVTVEWARRKYDKKYQRYEKRRTRVKAHDELGMKVGDKVEIMETRPISKTKHFLVLRKIE